MSLRRMQRFEDGRPARGVCHGAPPIPRMATSPGKMVLLAD